MYVWTCIGKYLQNIIKFKYFKQFILEHIMVKYINPRPYRIECDKFLWPETVIEDSNLQCGLDTRVHDFNGELLNLPKDTLKQTTNLNLVPQYSNFMYTLEYDWLTQRSKYPTNRSKMCKMLKNGGPAWLPHFFMPKIKQSKVGQTYSRQMRDVDKFW